MVVLVLFILILSSASSLRIRRKRILKSQELALAPKIFVQPANSKAVRKFLDGRITLMNLQSQGALMLVDEGESKSASTSSYFLKSDQPFQFHSTLLTVNESGCVEIHASLKQSRDLIVFRKNDCESVRTFPEQRSAL